MYPRTNYEMTQDQLDAILAACAPVPYMIIGGIAPRSQQENANDAWAALGKEMGFDHMTVQPIRGKDSRHFTAVPSETESQRADRVAKAVDAARAKEIAETETSIAKLTKRLEMLKAAP